MQQKREMYGYLAVVGAAAMWGIGGTVAKSLFNQSISPFLLVKIRLTLAFLLLVIGLYVYDRRLLHIPRSEIPYFAKMGIAGMAMVQFAYYYTIDLTNVATAVFLQYLAPVFIAIYAVVWEKEKLGRYRGFAVFFAALGGFCIVLDSGGVMGISMLGLVSGLAAALALAFNTIYIRRAVREYHPLTVVTYSFGFGALFWLVIPWGWELTALNSTHWLMFLYIVVFSTIIPFLLFFTGIRFLSATNVGVTACLEPVIAAVTAYAVLGEIMGSLQIVGGFLVIVAVIILQVERARSVS